MDFLGFFHPWSNNDTYKHGSGKPFPFFTHTPVIEEKGIQLISALIRKRNQIGGPNTKTLR